MIEKNDDWKGDQLISAKPKGTKEKRSIAQQQRVSVQMEQRRRQGKGVSQSDALWARQFRGYWKCGGPSR